MIAAPKSEQARAPSPPNATAAQRSTRAKAALRRMSHDELRAPR